MRWLNQGYLKKIIKFKNNSKYIYINIFKNNQIYKKNILEKYILII